MFLGLLKLKDMYNKEISKPCPLFCFMRPTANYSNPTSTAIAVSKQ